MALQDQFFFQRAAALEDSNNKFITTLCFTLLGISLTASKFTDKTESTVIIFSVIAWMCFLTAGMMSYGVAVRFETASRRRATIDNCGDRYAELVSLGGTSEKDAAEKLTLIDDVDELTKEAEPFNKNTTRSATSVRWILGSGLVCIMLARIFEAVLAI
jgi:hypothetical protein